MSNDATNPANNEYFIHYVKQSAEMLRQAASFLEHGISFLELNKSDFNKVEYEYRDLTPSEEEEHLAHYAELGQEPLRGYRRCWRRPVGTEMWFLHHEKEADVTHRCSYGGIEYEYRKISAEHKEQYFRFLTGRPMPGSRSLCWRRIAGSDTWPIHFATEAEYAKAFPTEEEQP